MQFPRVFQFPQVSRIFRRFHGTPASALVHRMVCTHHDTPWHPIIMPPAGSFQFYVLISLFFVFLLFGSASPSRGPFWLGAHTLMHSQHLPEPAASSQQQAAAKRKYSVYERNKKDRSDICVTIVFFVNCCVHVLSHHTYE